MFKVLQLCGFATVIAVEKIPIPNFFPSQSITQSKNILPLKDAFERKIT